VSAARVCSLAAALAVSACAGGPLAHSCPPVKTYTAEFNAAFADQLEALPLPEYWALAEALGDYVLLRDLARLCR